MAQVLRGNMYYVDFGTIVGSEQGGMRPAVVISNNRGNSHGPTVIVAACTTANKPGYLPTHVQIEAFACEYLLESTTTCLEQIRTVDKSRLKDFIGSLSEKDMKRINTAIKRSLELED